MIPVTTRSHPDAAVRYPREIAAAVTLPAACAALVAPGDAPSSRRASIAVVTACGALATRLAVIRFLADPGPIEPRAVAAFDPFSDPTPPALCGFGVLYKTPSPRDATRCGYGGCWVIKKQG
ncbi:hypothetical protein ACEN85_04925, partial [Curtobacterium sp. CT11-45]|uniref:hypothetical protein n=1 Tax=Curtobacterium sp. CT11-45 TaxID=3243037 RepID=UPI0039AF392B